MTDTQEAMRDEFDSVWKTKSGLDEHSYIGYEQAFVVWKLATEHERNNKWVRDKSFRDTHKNIDSNLDGWDYIKRLEHESAQSAEKIARLEAENARLLKMAASTQADDMKLLTVLDDLFKAAHKACNVLDYGLVEDGCWEQLGAATDAAGKVIERNAEISTEALDVYVAEKMAGMQTIRYMRPNSQKWDSVQWAAFGVMADECRSSNLYKDGDAILVWVSEADICRVGIMVPPPSPEQKG